jgi:hypothetical protein
MATENTSGRKGRLGFRVSNRPVVRGRPVNQEAASGFGELPRAYGAPVLFAIARDPQTLFTCWNVDWQDVFARGEPVDRQVYMRVKKADGTDESESVVEPMLGSYYAVAAQPGGPYQVEIGYYDAAEGWRSVATSSAVTMPPDGASENVDVDLATVPFHLSFQRLMDLFRASSGNVLAGVMGRLQKRAALEEEDQLTPEEWQVLGAMGLSLSEMDLARRRFSNGRDNDFLRKRTEAILGFGATSPAHGFGGSSRSSSAV